MDKNIQDLRRYLDHCPTAWHAVSTISEDLINAGFTALSEKERWNLEAGKKYFVTRNGSSICAFTVPSSKPKRATIVGAHTDSPSLQLKPHSEYREENMVLLGVEVYGGPILASWFNRELGIAGRISYANEKGEIQTELVDVREHPIIIPQLAIHLDREINTQGFLPNKQEHLPALACLTSKLGENERYLDKVLSPYLKGRKLLEKDLLLYPIEGSRLLGYNEELLASYRIDNLASTHSALRAFLEAEHSSSDTLNIMISWDNEEVGSSTAQGAASPFLGQVLERICHALEMDQQDWLCLLSRSFCISVDMAHALHPNYKKQYEPRHQPLMEGGVTLKVNAQQRYASNALSSGLIAQLCEEEKLNLQKFVVKSDSPCGSTIGPITATQFGMATVDIGSPQLAMHASRELTACQDHLDMIQLLRAAYNKRPELH
ncbi:MAG: M18 family aminopeptidase [Waddliaceae bacterium]|nr:M18 family aminopeptidase [Waddliaceae bacterium]